jgi:hypothetical protein
MSAVIDHLVICRFKVWADGANEGCKDGGRIGKKEASVKKPGVSEVKAKCLRCIFLARDDVS